jgi:ligand-binding sensor domain-containing protein
MKSGLKKLMVALLSLTMATGVMAGNWINFSNYTEVTSIAVRNGNEVWVAAKGGLLMYNQTSGEKTYFIKGPDELPSLAIERVRVHPQTNDIWIGTYDNGIAYVHNGTWTHLPFPEHDARLYEMKIADNGDVWAATTRGLYRCRNNQYTSFLTSAPQSVSLCWDFDFLPNGKILGAFFKPFIFDPATNENHMLTSTTFAYGSSSVTVKNDSVFYFSTDHGDLAEFHDTTEVDTVHLGAEAKDILFSAAGDKFLLESKVILQLVGGVFTPWNVANGNATAIVEGNNIFWVGTSNDYGQILRTTTLGQAFLVDLRHSDITSNWVRSINASNDGNILITHDKGVQKYDLTTRTFTDSWGLNTGYENFNEAIELNGKLYAGTSNSYLYEFVSSDSFRILGNGILPDNEVSHLAKDNQGNLWLCGPGYIAKYNGNNFTIYNSTNNANLTTNLYLRDIHFDVTRNVVWVSSFEGIFKIQNGALSFYNATTPGIQQYYDVVEMITEDDQHNIWFGTVYGGIIKFDGTSFSTMVLPETAGNQYVTGIQFDGNTMYVSDNLHGIWKYENNQWDSLTIRNSRLTNNFITGLYMDAQKNLWAGNLLYGVDVYNKNGVTLSVNDAIDVPVFTTYPNPSRGMFVIESTGTMEMELEVLSAEGKLVYNSRVEGAKVTIDLAGQPAGLYICKVKSAQGIQTLKLILQ